MHEPETSDRPTNRRQNAPRPARTRTDASGGWREEYALQVVDDDHELRADGGSRYILPSVGTRVRDRDDEDGEDLLVVDVSDTPADERTIDAIDATVADVNPEYDPDAPTVEAVYLDELEHALDGGWRSVEDVKDAISFDAVRSYTFPADRLASTSGGGSA
jgi:hypothetical protein